MTKGNPPKIVFIDTNIFISCIYEELDKLNLDVLENIFKELEGGRMILVLPEIIKQEILFDLKERFNAIKVATPKKFKGINFSDVLKKNNSNAVDKLIKESADNFLKKFEKRYKQTTAIIEKVFVHKNTKTVSLTEKLIVSGIRRSLLKRAPYSGGEKAYAKDCDCIAFESLLSFLKKGKRNQYCVICSNDSDYFENDENNKDEISKEIISDIKKCCKEVIGYRNLLEMLKKEFGAEYTDEQIVKFEKEDLSFPYLASSRIYPGATIELFNSGRCMMRPLSADFQNSNSISRDTKHCPVCSKNIKDYIDGFLISESNARAIVSAYSVLNSANQFVCPYCKSEFYIL